MNTPSREQVSRLNLTDIYHILFRHKWKILLVWAVGFSAAAALKLTWPVPYQSGARLLVRYVVENRSLSPVGMDSNIQTPVQGGGIINSEIEILTSYDLALQVADTIGPSRILAEASGSTNRYRAASLIHKNLKVEVPNNGTVIHLIFEDSKPDIVQPVLTEVIEAYLKKHAEIHQMAGTLDGFLTEQTDRLRTELKQTEEELRNAKLRANVISLADTRKAYAERTVKIQEDLFVAQADLAERQVALTELTNLLSAKVASNSPSHFPAAPVTPAEDLAEYRRASAFLESVKAKEQELLLLYTTNNYLVQTIQAQIAEKQKVKDRFEQEYPELISTMVVGPAVDGQPGVSRLDVSSQAAKVREIKSRIGVLNQQLDQIRKEAVAVNDVEGMITDLERKRDMLEQNYTHFSTSLNNARFDETLGAGRNSNINVIQAPLPPFKDEGKLPKIVALVLAGTLAAGIALAFVIELYLDRSFKRPGEIESELGLPLFLSIPRAKLNGKHKLPGAADRQRLLVQGQPENQNGTDAGTSQSESTEIASWKQNHQLRSYFEALRDRLVVYFEVRNLTHKPKLVAVTSCAEGSGVSTIATGLAACLSQTGDGNVLLVHMNDFDQSSAHYFHKGELKCGLDEALENEKRDSAFVQDNLYVVSEGASDSNLPQILHKRFSSLMPKLKASDYDYIIFDMPPVSQISPTTRLAPFMDMMFMVVEAEKTDRDIIKRATDLLAESKTTVGVVLNKTRTYIPQRLQQGFPGDI